MKLLREPLAHFLLLGAAVFVVYSLVSEDRGGQPGHIIITQGKIDNLVATFARIWQRPPADQELAGLIQDYIREEVLYLDAQRRGAYLARDMDRLLAELQQAGGNADPAVLGDAFLLAHEFKDTSATDVRKVFGDTFLTGLSALTPGQWQGPVSSGYGVHLVYVSERTEERIPKLAEVRDAVRREWANARRLDANETFYQRLLQRYTVTVERPPLPDAERNVMEVRR
jgi:hypothetical protein